MEEVKPCLHYFPYAGRGELTRLIAACGGLEIEEIAEVEDTACFGSPGTLPVLAHGDLKIAQSFAVESYVASIAPGFASLSAEQRAIDCMFCKIKEDALQGFADVLAGIASDESKRATAAEDVAAVCEKWFPIIEGRIPEVGFIHSLDLPTAADLAVLNMAHAFMPFGAAYTLGAYPVFGKFPKFAAHAARVAEQEAVRSYVEKSPTMAADPLGLGAGQAAQGKAQAHKISELAAETAELWHAVNCPVPDCAVVWLHGLGETEVYWQELFEDCNVLDLSKLGECRWIMPRALPHPCTARGGASTFQWFDTIEFPVCLTIPGVPGRSRKDESVAEIHAAVHRVHEAILALEVEGVPADRIAVAGFGQGGALAAHAALSYPKGLAGVAMLSGYLPCLETLEVFTTEAGLGIDFLWLHGLNDAVVPVDAATAQANVLSELGVRLDFRLGIDYGHETTTEGLHSFKAWLIAKLSSKPEEEPAAEEHISEEAEKVKVDTHLRQDPWAAPHH